jgi:hypothetical protein
VLPLHEMRRRTLLLLITSGRIFGCVAFSLDFGSFGGGACGRTSFFLTVV